MSVECVGCRLPVPFILPCSLCKYQEGCRRSDWDVDHPDVLRREYIEFIQTGKKPEHG